jgi:hypothetical protein
MAAFTGAPTRFDPNTSAMDHYFWIANYDGLGDKLYLSKEDPVFKPKKKGPLHTPNILTFWQRESQQNVLVMSQSVS